MRDNIPRGQNVSSKGEYLQQMWQTESFPENCKSRNTVKNINCEPNLSSDDQDF
jgi:hypothetical protein